MHIKNVHFGALDTESRLIEPRVFSANGNTSADLLKWLGQTAHELGSSRLTSPMFLRCLVYHVVGKLKPADVQLTVLSLCVDVREHSSHPSIRVPKATNMHFWTFNDYLRMGKGTKT